MNCSQRTVLVLAAIASLAVAPIAACGEPIAIEVGKPFPDLRLPTLDGGFQSIAGFRGQKVVLHVFASW